MITIREVMGSEIDALVPLLLEAEEEERALRWGLRHLVDAVYRMDGDGRLVGAATMQWRDDPCELMELAIMPERRGQGLGRRFVAWLADEARRRGKRAMLVGTANASIGNIVFYQRLGFRMDHVRRDYFSYHRQRHMENGIPIRDMLVFRMEL
jgi:GNAT superfamily N-acetyltransferase